MPKSFRTLVVMTLVVAMVGCKITHPHHHVADLAAKCPPPLEMPRELAKVALPIYTIEPPDILVIEAINVVPRSPYTLRTGDLISINVPAVQSEPNDPITGVYPVQPGGIVNLGPSYGTVQVSGMTMQVAQATIKQYLEKQYLNEANVSVSLVETAGKQQISGQHLVGPDGTITLGSYGSVPVVGLTLAQAKQVVETHLSNFLEDPEVAIDMFAYNSKVYYVITEGAGVGDTVTRLPITGNETVLDAIANINGLNELTSKRIWIARPAPHGEAPQVLACDWRGITALGAASSNYQIMPGDRVFVAEDKRVAFDTDMAKTFAPLERAAGFTLLQTNLATRLSGKVLQGGGNPGAFGSGS